MDPAPTAGGEGCPPNVSYCPAFVRPPETAALSFVDFLYFSTITLATVGYGDLVPALRLGRALAVLEGLMGQLYLVTVVALVVSHIGWRRPGDLG